MKWHQRLFALLIILLPTQLGYHFWPEWAMVLGRRIDYLSPTIYLTDIIILLLLSFWFFEGVPRFKKSIILSGLFIGINIYFSVNQPAALYKWIKVLEFGLLGWYIVKTKPNFPFITFCLSVGILYSSLIAVGQFFFQHSLGGIFWLLGERTFTVDTPGIARVALSGQEFLRAYGTFPHPNVLGGFLAVTLPLLLQAKKSLPRRQAGKWFYMSFGLGVIALILTFSRSAWFVGLVAMIVILTKRKKSLLFISVILVLIAIQINFKEESVVVREQLNNAALSLWQHSPLVGVGLGNFLVRLPEVLASRQIYFLQPVHNIYLLVLAETGIIGFIMVLLLLRHTIKKLQIPLIALLLLGFVDHYPLTLQQGQLLFTLVLALGLVQ